MQPTPPMVVGREAEVGRLSARARAAADGRGAVVRIDGVPGLGKTTLLDLVAAECSGLGMRVLRGKAEDLEQLMPFSAIDGCLGMRNRADGEGEPDPEVARIARLLRGEDVFGQTTVAANHEFVVTEAILDLLDTWSAAGPVALILDDVQWADPASMVVLQRLGRQIDQQPLLMVLASRLPPQNEALTRLQSGLPARSTEVVTLTPLTEAEVAALATRLLAAPLGPALSALVSGTGGNPLFVTGLLSALVREGAVGHVGGTAELIGPVPDRVPKSLVGLVLRQLRFLPRTTRETLQRAAALGPTVDVAELSVVLDVPVHALSDVVSDGIDVGLLTDSGPSLCFRHDLIREALAENVPRTVRTALHLRAGQVLIAGGASVERVAEHLLAGAALNRPALAWLVESAGILIPRAPGAAVDLLRRALECAEDAQTVQTLRMQLVRALLWAGAPVDAERAARSALSSIHDPAMEGELRWLLAQACYRQGHLADVIAVTGQAVSSPLLSRGELGRFQGFTAICLFFLARFDESELAARNAVANGAAGGDAYATAIGHSALSALRFLEGRMVRALELNQLVVTTFEQGVQPDLQVDPYAMQGYCLLELNRLPEADRSLATSVRHNQETGGSYLTVSYMLRAELRFLDGRWDDALAEIATGLDGPDPLGYSRGMRGIESLIAIHRGTVTAEAATSAPEPEIPPEPEKSSGYFERWALALALETRSGPQAALDALYPMWEHPAGLDPRRALFRICPDLARLAVAVGDRKRVRGLADGIEELAGLEPTDSLVATGLLCRGLADDDPEPLLAAAETFRRAGWPLYEGHAFENAAAILAHRGDVSAARDALNRALALYTELDAAWIVNRAEARLRQEGVRRGVHGPRKRPKHGWEALTGTEQKVATLVAEGLSNPDIAAQMFLSRRTVQSHVSSIFAKLGLSSRVELVLSAAQRDKSPAM